MITIIWIILLLILLPLCYVFFAPFYLELDSTKNLYRLRFHHAASVSFQLIDDSPFLLLRILGWTKQVDILAMKPTTEPGQQKKITPAKKRRTSRSKISWKKMLNVLASFRINHCQISLDFGDVQVNALLYPIVYWIRIKTKKNIAINFTGHNELQLEIKNSLARMSWAYISSP